jgi:hypothetical protein
VVGFGPRRLGNLLAVATPVTRAAGEVATATDRLAGPDGLCARDTTVDLHDAVCG